MSGRNSKGRVSEDPHFVSSERSQTTDSVFVQLACELVNYMHRLIYVRLPMFAMRFAVCCDLDSFLYEITWRAMCSPAVFILDFHFPAFLFLVASFFLFVIAFGTENNVDRHSWSSLMSITIENEIY